MRSRMIAIATGFVVAGWQPQLLLLSFCIAIGCFFLLLIRFKANRYGLLLCWLVAGFLYSTLWSYWQLCHKLPNEYVRSDWRVVGTVIGLPRSDQGVTYFNLNVTSIRSLDMDVSEVVNVRKLKLSWYKPSLELKAGDVLSLDVRLKPPHGQLNPNGFDYERWLFVRGIDATGYVRSLTIVDESSFHFISHLRSLINNSIESRYELLKEQALLQALMTGYKQNFTSDNWDVLRASGTVHLAVISGLHIGFMAAVGWFLGRGLCFLAPRILFYAPYLFSIAFAGFYMLLAGAEIPTQRAFIMLLVFVVSAMMRWFVDHWTRWWLALVCVLVISPLAIFEVGLWLSFSAVAMLLWFSQMTVSRYSALKLQFALLFAMLPLYLLFFSAVSLAAPFINIVAIPLISLLVIISFLNVALSSIGLFWLNAIEQWLVTLFWWLVEHVAAWSWSFVDIQGLSFASLLLVVVASFITVSPKGWIAKPMASLLLLPLVFKPAGDANLEGEYKVTVFDVGQGLSVLVEVNEYRLIYDTGASYKSGSSAFERSVLPYLKANGIDEIDHLILSHNDNDHVGGVKELKDNIDVGVIYQSYGEETEYKKHCKRGGKWNVGPTSFEFLAGSVGIKDNDRSCVLLITNGMCSLLLPGDIGSRVERQISSYQPYPIDWLVAAHHGSKTSTTEALLNSFKPQAVIFSAGFGNSFNHPHPEVVSRVAKRNAHSYATADDGAIILNSTAKAGCQMQTMRSDSIRLWR